MDPVENAKASMGGMERMFSTLPGVQGYREKEMRRDADRQVRDQFVRELEVRRAGIARLELDLLAAGGLLWMDDLERLVGSVQLLMDRVRTAPSGYAGFFDLQRVKEPELEKLAQFDKALFESLPKLDEALAALEKAAGANEGIQQAVNAVADLLAQLGDTFGRRMEAIRNA
jgi:hypothetical protein